MGIEEKERRGESLWFLSGRAWLLLWAPIIVVSALHYSTGLTHYWLHDVFRRMYYIPIVLGAFSFGLKGALSASVVASLIYAPHAFTHLFHKDPADTLEKFLEIALYNVVAYITGYLAARERSERLKQESVARRLQDALDEKQQLEEQLIRSGRLQALGELTAGLAHEIKNPLASIKGAAEIITDEIPKDSPRWKMVEIQKRELERLSSILERFLSFARPQKFNVSKVNLGDILDNVVTLMDAQLKKQNISVIKPSMEEPLIINGDKEKLTQVFINLILNAKEAMPDGGEIKLHSLIAARGKHSYYVIEVSDTGVGVPKELREKIFNPFFSTKDTGSGLGLSISANIIAQHNGFIEAGENEDGKGARFSVFIPTE
ncbi:MAG: ATP-binding protein [Myxococcota bacterium]